jgi:hypothetical protein
MIPVSALSIPLRLIAYVQTSRKRKDAVLGQPVLLRFSGPQVFSTLRSQTAALLLRVSNSRLRPLRIRFYSSFVPWLRPACIEFGQDCVFKPVCKYIGLAHLGSLHGALVGVPWRVASAILSCSRNDRVGKVWNVKGSGCGSPTFMGDAFNLRLLGAAPVLAGTAPSSFRSRARQFRHPRSFVCVKLVTNILPSGSRYTLCLRCLIRFALCSLSRRKTSSLESIRAPLRYGCYNTASGEEAGCDVVISLPVDKAYVDWVYFFVKIKAWQNGGQLMRTTSKAAIHCGSTDA